VSIDATQREVSRSFGTVAAYRRRYRQLTEMTDLPRATVTEVVEWFRNRNGIWSQATIRQYRAAIRQEIETMQASTEAAGLMARLYSGPTPRKHGPPRTSARKRRSVALQEFDKLIGALQSGGHPDDRLAASLLAHNVLLFLRPCEWQSAQVEAGYLVVQNAKATNGRSFGPVRRRCLSSYRKSQVKGLTRLLSTLNSRAIAAGGYRLLWARLAARVARACAKLRIKRISLYTTRHIGMATAKGQMTAKQVAASAGHKKTVTAASHYAKKRSGWHLKAPRVARPHPDDVKKVIDSPKATRQANLEAIRERREHGLPSLRM